MSDRRVNYDLQPETGAGKAFFIVWRRDVILAVRNLGEIANPLIFFLIVVSLFPLGVGPAPKTLAILAPGVVWVVALLACMLSIDGMFKHDHEDGSLALILLSPQPLYGVTMSKVLAHWCTTGLPLTLFSPVLATMLYMPGEGILPLMASLALGTVSLSFVGAIGAALTVGLQRSGVLLSLIVLPLYIPVLIFGASAVQAALDGFEYSAQLAVLTAFLSLSLTLAPLAIGAALRISVDT